MILRRSRRDAQTLAARRLAVLSAGLDRAEASSAAGHGPDADPGRGSDADDLPPGRHADRGARPGERGFRLPMTSQHLAVVAMAIAAACVITGWLVLRSVPES
jgi:hypothetical protein